MGAAKVVRVGKILLDLGGICDVGLSISLDELMVRGVD
jgi:hypothetical protein